MSISEFALGAMMFGRMGNPDHDDSIRIMRRRPAALRAPSRLAAWLQAWAS
jgi:hypothetical protein